MELNSNLAFFMKEALSIFGFNGIYTLNYLKYFLIQAINIYNVSMNQPINILNPYASNVLLQSLKWKHYIILTGMICMLDYGILSRLQYIQGQGGKTRCPGRTIVHI